MATATTQAVWRSYGGDTTKTAYAGQMVMTATFYVVATGSSAFSLQRSSTDTSRIILPQNAIVMDITASVVNAAGTAPTISFGYIGNSTGTAFATTNGIVNAKSVTAAATTNLVLNITDAAFVKGVVTPLSTTELVYLTCTAGGTATGTNTINGMVRYVVTDNGASSG
jgi:hypothetical protein